MKIQDNNIYDKGLSGLLQNFYFTLLFRLWCSLETGILRHETKAYDKNLHQILVINIRFWMSNKYFLETSWKNIKPNFSNPGHFRFTLEEFPNYLLSCYFFILTVTFFFSLKHQKQARSQSKYLHTIFCLLS